MRSKSTRSTTSRSSTRSTTSKRRSTTRKAPRSTYRSRRRRKSSLNYKPIVITVLAIGLLVTLFVFAGTSPVFNIKPENIKIIGAKTIRPVDVMNRLNLPYDQNIFKLPKRRLAENVATNPVVDHATLYRDFIHMGLTVQVKERQPIALLSDGVSTYQVDAAGIPFRIVQPDGKLPVIAFKPVKPVVLGRRIPDPVYSSALRILPLADKEDIGTVTKITVDQNHDLCLNVRDGFLVKLGPPVRLADKLKDAALTIERVPRFRELGEYVDVTCVERPAYKLHGEPGTSVH